MIFPLLVQPTPIDLTDSLYVVIVLTYATFAGASYAFGTIESRGRTAIETIERLKAGEASFVWEQQDHAPRPRELLSGICNSYDILMSGKNHVIRRWDVVQYSLLTLIVTSSVLAIPVLLLKLEKLPSARFVFSVTAWMLIVEQTLLSACIITLVLNVEIVRRRLERVEKLAREMVCLADARSA